MQVIASRVLCFGAVGMICGFVLVAKQDWAPPESYLMVAVCVIILGVSAYVLWVMRWAHWCSWVGAAALCAPLMVIGYLYWNRAGTIEIRDVHMQLGYSAAVFAGLMVRSVGFSYVRDSQRCWCCGYSLRALPGPQCPECGSQSDVKRPYVALERRKRSPELQS